MKFSVIAAAAFIIQLSLGYSQALAQKVPLGNDPSTTEVSNQPQADEDTGGPVKTVHSMNSKNSNSQTQPATGQKAARKYFQKDAQDDNGGLTMTDDHFLMIGLGGFIHSTAYRWGDNNKKNPGELNLDVTYRFGEWVHSMDFLARIDYQTYNVGDPQKDPKKLSFMPMIIFPDAGSKFPIYFGAGGGLGVFFSQLDSKSSLSLDYQLIVGARFFDIFKNTGFYVETGLKNSLFLMSSGQFNGIFLNVGTVHTF